VRFGRVVRRGERHVEARACAGGGVGPARITAAAVTGLTESSNGPVVSLADDEFITDARAFSRDIPVEPLRTVHDHGAIVVEGVNGLIQGQQGAHSPTTIGSVSNKVEGRPGRVLRIDPEHGLVARPAWTKSRDAATPPRRSCVDTYRLASHTA